MGRRRGVSEVASSHHLAREFSSSEYAKTIQGLLRENRRISIWRRKNGCTNAWWRWLTRIVESAHDVSDGGLAVAIVESVSAGKLARRMAFDSFAPAEYALFGESGARAIVSTNQPQLARVMEIAAKCKVGARRNRRGRAGRSPASNKWSALRRGRSVRTERNLGGRAGTITAERSLRTNELAYLDDHFHDECGVFGIFGRGSREAYLSGALRAAASRPGIRRDCFQRRP